MGQEKSCMSFPFQQNDVTLPQFRGTVASLFPNISKSVMGLASLWKQFLWLGVVFHNVQRVPVDVILALGWGAWTSYRKWFCIIYHAEYWLWGKDSHKLAVNSCPPFTKIKFSTHLNFSSRSILCISTTLYLSEQDSPFDILLTDHCYKMISFI